MLHECIYIYTWNDAHGKYIYTTVIMGPRSLIKLSFLQQHQMHNSPYLLNMMMITYTHIIACEFVNP